MTKVKVAITFVVGVALGWVYSTITLGRSMRQNPKEWIQMIAEDAPHLELGVEEFDESGGPSGTQLDGGAFQ